MSVDDEDLWSSFRADAEESLRGIEESLLVLERHPRDAKAINSLYRGMHTLKSNAGYLRQLGLEHLAHIAEDAMGDVRTGTIAFDSALADLLLRVVDRLRRFVDEAAPGKGEEIPKDAEALCKNIQDMCETLRGRGAPPKDAATAAPPRVSEPPPEPEPAAFPTIDPQDDPEYLSIFLSLARDHLRLLTEAWSEQSMGTCTEADARGRIATAMEELSWAADRMGYGLLAETAVTLSRAASSSSVPFAELSEIEFDLCEQLVSVEAHYQGLTETPEPFGFDHAFRSSCARSLFVDLAELQHELDSPSEETRARTKRRFRRLREACEEYGLKAAEGELAACEDVVFRAIDAGARLEPEAHERTHALLRRVGAAAYALDTDPEGANAPEFGVFLPPKKSASLPFGLAITKELAAALEDSERHRLADLIESGSTIVEVATPGNMSDDASAAFYTWMGDTNATVLGSYLDANNPAADTLFLFALDGRKQPEGASLGALRRAVPGAKWRIIFGESDEISEDLPVETTATNTEARPSSATLDGDTKRAEREPEGNEAGPIAEGERGKDESRSRNDEYVRVGAHKLALVMELAGEIGLASGAVTAHPDLVGLELEGFSTAAHKLELLVRELQSEVAALRLLPVDGIFQRMRRVARDAARRTGKQVELEFVGEDTEIDKVMLDSLAEPLVHLVRNAIDHGIEAPGDRARAGKSEAGHLLLEASHESGEAILQLTDDGAGLNTEAIRARAIERGLIAEGAVLSDDEITNLITLPGFSTKQAVDELSGRGVGMDVVRTTVEGLRGKLRIRSIAGKGTRVTMRMPLTLAFIDAMIIRAIDSLFAVPIERVHEVFRVQPAQVVRSSAGGAMMLRVREHLVPVCWLHKFYKRDGDEGGIVGQVVVVVQGASSRLALPVDALLGNQTIMLKPMTGVLSLVRAASGCGMLRSGEVALAIDCEQLNA